MTEYRHSTTARAVLRSLVPVICPPEASELADAIVEHMALTLAASPPMLQRGFALGLHAYDLGALPRYRRRARSLAGELTLGGEPGSRGVRSTDDVLEQRLEHGVDRGELGGLG